MASLNKRDRFWLWVVGLVSFAAFVMLLLFLSPGMYQLYLVFCEAQSTNGAKKPGIFCCRQTRDCCEDTEQKPTCDETKPRDEITFNPGNNPQVERLIRAVEARSPQYPVTEQRLPSYLAEKSACGNARFDMSDFILFGRTESEPDKDAKGQVVEFMGRNEQIKKLWLFSFTSPDGENNHNDQLALKRACAVRDEIPESFQGSISLAPMGEDHPINGIANSRSVVIAACRAAPGEAETAGKPDTTTLSCPEGD